MEQKYRLISYCHVVLWSGGAFNLAGICDWAAGDGEERKMIWAGCQSKLKAFIDLNGEVNE
jgi:hypothetical protein